MCPGFVSTPSCNPSKKEAHLSNKNKQMSQHVQFQAHSNSHRSLGISNHNANAPVMFPDNGAARSTVVQQCHPLMAPGSSLPQHLS